MKNIKQNIKQHAKRALSWLTTLTLILALAPVFTATADDPPAVRQRIGNLNLRSTTANVGPIGSANYNPSTENIDGSAEGWMWYINGHAGYPGNVLVLDGVDFLVNNNSTWENNNIRVPPATTIILRGENRLTMVPNNHAIEVGQVGGPSVEDGTFRITGGGRLTIETSVSTGIYIRGLIPFAVIENVGIEIRAGGTTSTRGIQVESGCHLTIRNSIIDITSVGNGIMVSTNGTLIEKSHVTATSTGAICLTIPNGVIRDSVVIAQGAAAGSGINASDRGFSIINSHVTAHGGTSGGSSFGINIGATVMWIREIENSTVTASGFAGAIGPANFTPVGGDVFRARTSEDRDDPGGDLGDYLSFTSDHKFVYLEIGTGGEPIPPVFGGGGAGSVRFTTPDFEDGDPEEDIDVQARIVLLAADVYRIDIAWGNMKFVFDINSHWDFANREYVAGQGIWLINNGEESGSLEGYLDGVNNKVTVTNRSNDGVDVDFDFELETPNLFNDDGNDNDRVQGNFFATNELAQAGALILDTDTTPVPGIFAGTHAIESADERDLGNIYTFPYAEVFFAFSGTPDKETFDSFQRAGIITVTITPNNN